MTDPLLAQTKLDAVNTMLVSIGQAPLNALVTTGIQDAAIAEMHLDSTLRQVLLRGWSFNTDRGFELIPDANDNILVPTDALQITTEDVSKDYVPRVNGDTKMLYDREENTFTITDNPLKVTIHRAMSFEDIPEAARGYIATRAARLFQANIIASNVLFKYTELHEKEAFAILRKLERRTKKLNIFRAGTDSNQIIQRFANPIR